MIKFGFIVVITTSLFIRVLSDIDPCPPAMQIKPCTCSSVPAPVIQCESITDMEVIIEVFRKSGDRRFRMFALHHSSIMYLPVSSLISKHIKDMYILNTTMTSLFDELPDESNEVRMMTLQNVTLQRGIRWELFGNLKKLLLFQAKDMKIRTLAKSFSDNINTGITHFILDNTETKKLSDDVFASLLNLRHIEISNGKIRILKRSMFPSPAQIRKFTFTNNLIDSLPNDIFTDMPELKDVRLELNKITVFSEEIFGDAYNRVSILNLKGNPINCDCTLRWFISRKWKFVNAHCAAPTDKIGRALKSLTEEDFHYC